MSLQTRCLNEVLPRDRERGVRYFQQRRVSLGARESDGIAATVEGSGGAAYEVRLDWSRAEEGGQLAVSCSCPRFADFVICKHVWAVIVAFDGAQFTEPVPGRGPLELERELPGASVPGASVAPKEHIDEPRGTSPPRRRYGYFDPEGGYLPPTREVHPTPQSSREPEKPSREPEWRRQIASVKTALAEDRMRDPAKRWRYDRRVFYRLNVARCFEHDHLVVDLYQRKVRRSGDWAQFTKLNLARETTGAFPDAADRDLVHLFHASPTPDVDHYAYRYRTSYSRTSGVVPALLYEAILPQLCATGRFGWVRDANADPADATALEWDAGAPWRFVLELDRLDDSDTARLTGHLGRDGERRSLPEPILLLANGVVVWEHAISRLDAATRVFPWVSLLRREAEVQVPVGELDVLLEDLSGMPELPEIEMPEEWRWGEARVAPQPRLVLRPVASHESRKLDGDVVFDYDGCLVPAHRQASRVFDRERRRLLHRDPEAEQAAFDHLESFGVKRTSWPRDSRRVQLTDEVFSDAIRPLLAAGWVVEAEGGRVRPAGELSLSVSSGIDWFELRGDAAFEGAGVALPRLLAAVRRGERMVRLDDGSQGMLPEEWLERYGPLARMAHGGEGDAVRYLPTQAALLDALLAAEPAVDVDRGFARVRDRLRSFDRVKPAGEPRGFHGKLRAYQRDGLGWLKFLQGLGLGGCLADDMGLGKTVQVLALLQARRLGRSGKGRPSLIVAPRSLVHNWIEEAGRFTPRLGMAAYSGPHRGRLLHELGRHDALVTTYGLLRRDVAELSEIDFDYAILDEAQAIKNASSQGAKAARLIRARHRLALTGTPVENHLGELWSIFEFLNPGMLGRQPAFKKLTRGRALDAEALGAFARALRPFILRRTKEEVLKDLPAKTEQTLYCELERPQRKLYEELRDHYRAALSQRIEDKGLERSKIHVLEALLRLRQAACHPGLVDPARDGQSSAKLETLLEQVEEVIDGGHKALVFSQFVRLLDIVKGRLEKSRTAFEYLDGKTRDRRRRIERFQTDPDCKLFLISLKAGGLGLNLTAADYVFILDPWWNPAVEAQAIDRTHRIGQTRPVFAYRLIASDTVEEKILDLQQSKRELADAILSQSKSVIKDLTADDLRLLLS